MYIIEEYNYSLDEYIGHIEKIGKNNPQERNYQELISYFLKRIFINTDIEVIDVSTNRNTKLHNRDNYTGNGGTPDLLLARGYQYVNIGIQEQSIEYIAAIEIKAYKHLNESKLIKVHEKQLESHLFKNKKVIFTDCVTWCFFRNCNLEPERSFNLKCNPNEWNELQNYIREFVYKK